MLVRRLYGQVVSQPFPTRLSSARLILRQLQRGDVAGLCAYRSLPEVARFQSWESFGPDDAARLIAGQTDLEPGVPGTWFQWGIVEAVTGNLVGDCGLHCLQEDPRRLEVGITLAPSHQGRGYATEALSCLLDVAFGALGKHRLSAVTDAENHAVISIWAPSHGARITATITCGGAMRTSRLQGGQPSPTSGPNSCWTDPFAVRSRN